MFLKNLKKTLFLLDLPTRVLKLLKLYKNAKTQNKDGSSRVILQSDMLLDDEEEGNGLDSQGGGSSFSNASSNAFS